MLELLFLAFFEGIFTMGPDSWSGFPLLFKVCLFALVGLTFLKGILDD